MSLTTTLKILLNANFSSPADLAARAATTSIAETYSLANGTGAGQADLIWSDERTVGLSTSENLDLAGVLVPLLGTVALTFVRIKLVMVTADSGNTNDVQVTRPGSLGVPLFMAAGDGIALKPGASFVWVDSGATGVPVTGGTGDILTVANSGGGTTVTYRIVIIGASA